MLAREWCVYFSRTRIYYCTAEGQRCGTCAQSLLLL